MEYKTVSGAQSAEIELDGSVYTVNFGHGYKYYAVRNDGSGTIYVSTTDKSCTPKNDGVVSIPSGGSYVHCNGYGGNPEIYFNGSGAATVIAQEDGNNPFRKARKGGGGNAGSNILPCSDGLTYFFDYQNGVSATGWKDLVQGYTLGCETVSNDEYMAFVGDARPDWNVKKSFTIYAVAKVEQTRFDTEILMGLMGGEPANSRFLVMVTKNKKIGVLTPPWKEWYSTVTTEVLNIYTLLVFKEKVFFYINGKYAYSYEIQNWDTYVSKWIIRSCAETDVRRLFKSIAIFEDVAQNDDDIAVNSQYLAQKYGIDI